MPIYKKWYAKSGVLYQPRRVVYDFLFIWFGIVYLLVLSFLKPNLFIWISVFMVLAIGGRFLLEFKRFGWLGEPVVLFLDNKIIVNTKSSFSKGVSIQVDIYADDVVHIVGVENLRFIRLIGKDRPNRELKLNYSQRLIKYITKKLAKKHKIVIEDYPSFMSQCRGDY